MSPGGALKDQGIKVRLDAREQIKPGAKFFEWEKKGVPVRLELGPRDVASGQTMLVRRDDGSKTATPLAAAAANMGALLKEIQKSLFHRASAFREAHTSRADDWAEFEKKLEEPGGFISAHWDGTKETEAAIKEKTKATIRVLPTDEEPESGKCVLSGQASKQRVLFARSY